MAIFLALGLIIYIATVLDILQTTLSMQGGGWLTSRYSHLFWKLFLFVSGGNGKSKILSHAGYILLISIVLIWVFLLWISFVLILISQPGIIVNSSTQIPADLLEIIYYSGYTLSTLGMGDFIAAGNGGRILTSFYSFTGLILLTMSVTYFIPVLSAVIEQRKLGIRLSILGSSPEKIILNFWDGKSFQSFISKVDELSGSIIKYSQQHRAYPVIHYFHNHKEKNAIILQLARLYEAYLILAFNLNDRVKPEPGDLRPLDIAFENYFEVLKEVTHINTSNETPAYSTLQKLEELSLIDKSKGNHALDTKSEDLRKIFLTLVQQDGWNWNQVDKKKS